MTIDKKDTIQIPRWLILFVVPIIVGGISGIATSAFSAGKKVQQIETLKKEVDENALQVKELKSNEIEYLRNNKADKEVVDKIYNSLVRIENKFDQHIVGSKSKGGAQ